MVDETIDVSQRGTEWRTPLERRQASCRHRHQRDEPAEIEGGAREAKEPVDLRESAQLHFPDPGDRLEPAKRRLDPWPRMQTLRVAVVPGGARVDGAAAAALQVLRHVGRDLECPQAPRRGRTCRRPCRRRPCVGADRAASARAASASPRRARRCRRPRSPSRPRSARGDSRSADARDTPAAPRHSRSSDTAWRRDRSSRHACHSCASGRGSCARRRRAGPSFV